VEAAVKSSHTAYFKWRQVPIGKPAGYIFAIHSAMRNNLEKLAQSIAIDQAKHISEVRSEVQRIIEIMEMACNAPVLLQGETLTHFAPGYQWSRYATAAGRVLWPAQLHRFLVSSL